MQGWVERRVKEARPSPGVPSRWNRRYYALYLGGAAACGSRLPAAPMLYYFTSIDDCGAFFRASRRPNSTLKARGYIKLAAVDSATFAPADVGCGDGGGSVARRAFVLRHGRTAWTFRPDAESGETSEAWVSALLAAMAPLKRARWIEGAAMRRWRAHAAHERAVRFHIERTDHRRACALQAAVLASWSQEAAERVDMRAAAHHFRRRRPLRRAALRAALGAWRREVRVVNFRATQRARGAVRRWASWRRS